MTEEQRARLLQFQHPEKVLAAYRGSPLSEAELASILGVEPALYHRVRQRSQERVAAAAQQILTDPSLARAVDRLPFGRGDTVVGLGDSITDDEQSWLEILRELLILRRPGDGIRLINAGISADTTAQIIARFLEVRRLRPDWIICLAGTNDARRHGYPEALAVASLEQTAQNLRALRQLAARTEARWIWITPPPVIEEQVVTDWHLGPLELSYRNHDLAAIAALIRQFSDPVVDLQRVFGDPVDRDLLLPDGLHPSLAGQVAIVTALIRQFS
jgi:acyl-CoA thioesterase-1